MAVLRRGSRVLIWGLDEEGMEELRVLKESVTWVPIGKEASVEEVAWLCGLPMEEKIADLTKPPVLLVDDDRTYLKSQARLVAATGGLPDDLRGWVTLPTEDGWRVFFVQEKDGADCGMLSVSVDEDGAGPLRRSETCGPLTPDQRAMFRSRQTALAALRTPCSRAYNTVVLPHEGPEAAWAVYLLAATEEAGKVVVGGHARVLVGDDGSRIVDYQELSKSCLTLEIPPSDGEKAVVLAVTHVLDDHPIETHVFLSLLHGQSFYVMTETALWSVAEGEIRLLMDGEDFQAYLKGARETAAEDER